MAEKVKILTNDNFKDEVLNSDGVVLIDFHASWCRPCKALSGSIDELGTEFDGRATICKADVEENSDVVGCLGINAVPTILIYKSGGLLERFTGMRSKSDLKSDLEKAIDE